MFNLGALGAAVTLDDSEYRQKLQGLGSYTKSVLGKVAGVAAAYLSFDMLKNAAISCTKAFIVQEDAVNGLERALANKGSSAYSEQLQKLAGDLQLVTTHGDEATIATMALGINMGIPAAKMNDATRAAMGLAAAYNMDLNTAMQLIAKAYAGNAGALGRYGIQIDTTKSKQQQFEQVLEKGKAAFPLAEAQTTGQKLAQLQNVWGDLMEAVGEFIVELFDVGDASDGLCKKISDATEYIKNHIDEWCFEIKYVYAYFEEGVKAAWAIFEPAVTYLWQCFKAGINNIVAIAQWGFENAGTIWEGLPDIFIGIGKDILQYWKNVFTGLLNLAVNLGKAIWKAIKGGGLDGFADLWDDICKDAVRTIADYGKYTAEAMRNAGVSAFPELETGNFGEMVEKYKNIGDAFAKIDAERIEKQAKLEADYAEKLSRSKKAKNRLPNGGDNGGGGADEAGAGKNDVAGSFSAAVLSAMMGASSPERETAKNTKEMVRQLRRINEQQANSNTYI